jgi:hypothetical protein
MKFNKKLQEYIVKYEKEIPSSFWFNYKSIKKLINYVRKTYPGMRNQDIAVDDCCCICLENTGNMMHTFCCNNIIHHSCLVDVITKSSELCPLCRKNNADYFLNNTTAFDNQQTYDAKIIEIISRILLNIIRIENLSQIMTINANIIKNYKEINYIAVIKIAKKIYKYLHIDIREYVVVAMKKKNVLTPPSGKKHNKFAIWIKKQIKKMSYLKIK